MPKDRYKQRGRTRVTNEVSVSGDVIVGATVASTQSGTWTVVSSTVSTATLSNVSSSASNVTLLALNTSRKQAMIFNDSTQILYVKLGTTASATSFTVKLLGGGYYELPSPVYTGKIDGIWASAVGDARITELT